MSKPKSIAFAEQALDVMDHLDRHDIRWGLEEAEGGVLIAAPVGADENRKVVNATCIAADVSAKRIRRLMEDYIQLVVTQACADAGLETMIEMHAEVAIERAVQAAVEKGWSGQGSVEKEVARKVRELASARVARDYKVEVSAQLVRKPR